MIKAVFIDIDGTLLDFDAYVEESMKSGFSKYGLRPYEDWMFDVFRPINRELWQQVERGELTFDELKVCRWNKIFEALDIEFDGEIFERYFRECLFDSAIPIAGAMEMLEYLHGKYILCVASNGPYDQQVNRLRVGGMLDYFSHVFISEGIGASKPTKAFFSYGLKELNTGKDEPIAANEVMMIGDSLSADMAGGLDSGLKTCWFASDGTPTERLQVDYIIESLYKIKGIL